MWLKLFLLLTYIFLLFILSRVLEAIYWYESGYSGLLDPMVISVVKLRALLDQRGVSYDGVVEKSELTSLVDSSGHVSAEEIAAAQREGVDMPETNFTCGAHFIEQVEDAKDSVWLVQVVRHSGQLRIVGDMRWKAIRKKVSRFGVRTGLLDCSLDLRYCYQKGWHSPFLLLALPSEFEKKASIAMHNYSGPVHETVVMRWVRDKLAERVVKIRDPAVLERGWQNFSTSPLDPEIRVVLFTESPSPPLFYSALTVKFPGRVKFGMVRIKSKSKLSAWRNNIERNHLPSYVIYSTERNYTYGSYPGEVLSFASMERFLKFLYPCLNDIFIISFCAANILSLLEFFVSNCGIFRRVTKCIWCIVKYNIIVIMLWLPIIGIFQMPFLDRMPLLALKVDRMITTSRIGTVFRGDFSFFQNHPMYVYLSFLVYLASVTYLCKKYRGEEEEPEGWFSFRQPATFLHIRPSNLLEPTGRDRYNVVPGLDTLGLTPQSLWLRPSISSDYIRHLHTWRYCPRSLAEEAANNVKNVEAAMGLKEGIGPQHGTEVSTKACDMDGARGLEPEHKNNTPNSKGSQGTRNQPDNVNACPSSVDHQRFHTTSDPSTSAPTYQSHALLEQGAASPSPAGCSHSLQDASSVETASVQGRTGQSSVSQDLTSASTVSLPSQLNLLEELGPDSQGRPSPSSPQQESVALLPISPSPATLRTSNFPLGYMDSHQCVICLEDYSPMVMLCGLPCGHVFHETCIITWLNTDKHFCPMCRWPSYQIPMTYPD